MFKGLRVFMEAGTHLAKGEVDKKALSEKQWGEII